MAKVRIGINGFGRIGRGFVRCLAATPDAFDLVLINDLTDVETLAHLLKHDSVHGKFPGTVTADGSGLVINGDRVEVSAEKDPAAIQWKKLGVDLVIEATGRFVDKESCGKHLAGGAKKVLISAPAKSPDVTLCCGINLEAYKPAEHHIISNASCTTNCLAPVAKVLNDAFGIEKGFMTTVHAYTGDQPTLDTMHKDLYRARAAALSMIPTSTGAAKAVGLVLPELNGKLDGVSIRVPTPNVSVIDFKFVSKKPVTVDEVNAALVAAANGPLKGILASTTEPLVSIDLNHNPASSTFALDQTKVIEGNLVRVMSWYDNEWGFSNRMSDTAVAMGKLI